MNAAAKDTRGYRWRYLLKEGMGFAVLAVLVLVFSIWSGGKLVSAHNIKNIIDQSTTIIVGGIGLIFVISMGSTDISIGAAAGVSSTAGCMLAALYGDWLVIPLTLGIALAIGLLNGVLASYFKVSSFMCTLAVLIALKGLMSLLIDGRTIYAPAFLKQLNQFPVKLAIMVALVLAMGYVYEGTRFGQYCKSMGENENCVASVGVNTKKLRVAAFAVSGLLAGFMGLFLMAKQGGASNTFSNFMEMKVMMAIFLGGVPTSGGFGARTYKLILGALTTSVIINGLTICQVSTAYTQMIQGVCLVGVLWMAGRLGARARAE